MNKIDLNLNNSYMDDVIKISVKKVLSFTGWYHLEFCKRIEE